MKYWIISLPRADMEHCIEIGKFGRSQRHTARVSEGDKVACYVTKERCITALGTVTQGFYEDNTPVFKGAGLYPYRFDFEAQRLTKDADFIKIIDQMSFITELAYWSVYFRLGLKEIPAADWRKLEKFCLEEERVR